MTNKGIVFLIIVLSLTACKKKTEEISMKSYTISGTYYDTDGETPKPNAELLLVPVSVDYFDPKEIKDFEQSCITDENGNYEFVYSQMKVSEKAEFAIGELIDHQLAAPFLLTAIPVDENIRRDICTGFLATTKIKFSSRLNNTDSVFINIGEWSDTIKSTFDIELNIKLAGSNVFDQNRKGGLFWGESQIELKDIINRFYQGERTEHILNHWETYEIASCPSTNLIEIDGKP
tara:strand:+ start:443 stop:1141 length:699 start_codon:yes stop_codon:yes gene_type:complete